MFNKRGTVLSFDSSEVKPSTRRAFGKAKQMLGKASRATVKATATGLRGSANVIEGLPSIGRNIREIAKG